MKRIFIVLCVTLLAVASYGKRKAAEPIILNKENVLYFIVIDNMNDYGSTDRFFHFKNTLEGLLEEVDFPMAYKIEEFPVRTPDAPYINLTIEKWGSTRWGEIEVRISAYMRNPATRNKNKLGYHVVSDVQPSFTGSSYVERKYNDLLKKALIKLARRLEEHLPTEIEYLEEEEAPSEPDSSAVVE